MLEVETDGSIAPGVAVAVAAEMVKRHMDYLLHFQVGGMKRAAAPEGGVPVPERLKDLLDRPLEDLAELSVRSRNSLQKENIKTLGELAQKTEEEMLNIENFGKKSLKEIQDFLAEHDLRFGLRIKKGDDGNLYFLEEEAGAGTTESSGE
jgi:DNA-directed RNA polymerase subunit alpha